MGRQRHPGATRRESTLGISPSPSTHYSHSLLLLLLLLLLLPTVDESIFRSNIDSAIVCERCERERASEREKERARERERARARARERVRAVQLGGDAPLKSVVFSECASE